MSIAFLKTNIYLLKFDRIKFDVSFPYGVNHEAYSAFSQAISNKTLSGNSHTDVLVATIGIKGKLKGT
jgi:hypothetical protein